MNRNKWASKMCRFLCRKSIDPGWRRSARRLKSRYALPYVGVKRKYRTVSKGSCKVVMGGQEAALTNVGVLSVTKWGDDPGKKIMARVTRSCGPCFHFK